MVKETILELTQVTDSIWYDGYRAFVLGTNPDCPYPLNTPAYFQWNNGYQEARNDYIEQWARNTNPHRPENS